MPQPANSDPIPLQSPAALDAASSISEVDSTAVVESYADSLMDELFDDVDQILTGNDTPKWAVEYSDAAEAASVSAEDEAPASALVPVSSTLDISQDSALDALAIKAEARKPLHWFGKTLDRLLVGAASVSLVFTAGFWLSQQQRNSERLIATIPEAAMTPEALKAEADAQFLKYLERSLDVLDDQIQASTAATSATSGVSLPTVTVNSANFAPTNGLAPPGGGVSGSASLFSNRSMGNRPNVIERVYIPVYQPPSSQGLPVLSNPAANPAANLAASGAIPNIAPNSIHVLVGVLELGDRSAALFEINGNPQRFYIGENISSSGWTLVSVANQEAVIRRNGEVRSVYVGQQF